MSILPRVGAHGCPINPLMVIWLADGWTRVTEHSQL